MPRIVAVTALPQDMGDCYIGQSEGTGQGCISGTQTGLTIGTAHLCNTGGHAGPDSAGCSFGQSAGVT
jgi:hypothetical protein